MFLCTMSNNNTGMSSTNTKMYRWGKIFSSVIHTGMQDPGKVSLDELEQAV